MGIEGYVLIGLTIIILLLQLVLLLRRPVRPDISREINELKQDLRQVMQENRQFTGEEFWKMEQRIKELGDDMGKLQAGIMREQRVQQQMLHENLTAQSERLNTTLRETVSRLQESNEKKLDQMRETVDEKLNTTLSERLDSSFRKVSEQLQSVYQSLGEMKNLAGDVNDLQRVLTNVKARGTWAEVQLGNLLEQTLTQSQYDTNVSIKKNGERVEYAIKIPSRDQEGTFVWLPIDSKFPQEDYLRLSEAAERADKEATDAAVKALERTIRKEAETISSLYIEVPATTDFAIMFLPTEGLYAEVLRRPGLTEEIQRKYRVMICGPTTITAFLNTLRIGFRTIALDRQAAQVWKLLEATKAQYETFGTQLEKAHRKIEEAGNAIGEAQKRSGIIQKRLKNVEMLDQEEAMDLLGLDKE